MYPRYWLQFFSQRMSMPAFRSFIYIYMKENTRKSHLAHTYTFDLYLVPCIFLIYHCYIIRCVRNIDSRQSSSKEKIPFESRKHPFIKFLTCTRIYHKQNTIVISIHFFLLDLDFYNIIM